MKQPKPTTGYGSKISGYTGFKGPTPPKRCDGCVHYEEGDRCDHPAVIADPQVKRTPDGHAKVSDGECCNYWWPEGKKGLGTKLADME